MRLRVIGVGTRRGDDAAGLAAAGHLARRALPPGVRVLTCERPAPDLLDALEGAEAAVLVDALRGGGEPGAVVRLDPDALARSRAVSSHGLSVAEALALAHALGRLPPRLAVVGIEVGEPHPDAAALSPPVARGARRAAVLVRELLEDLMR